METSQPTDKRLILPTLQSVLIHSWNSVLMPLGDGDYSLAWKRTQAFFDGVIPPIVEKECKEDYIKIKKELDQCGSDSIAYEDMVTNFSSGMTVLQEKLSPFLNKVKHSLFLHKYLEDDKFGRPKFQTNRKLKVDDNGSK